MNEFDFDKWWLENVGPIENVMDRVYQEITKDAIKAALKFYGLKIEKEQQMEKDVIDMENLDLSAVLNK